MQLDHTSKICKTCSATKPLPDFGRSGKYVRSECKACANERVRTWHRNNRERVRKIERRYRLTPQYRASRTATLDRYKDEIRLRARSLHCKYNGISIDRYAEMLRAQNEVCAICRQPERKKHHRTGHPWSLGIDHNHQCCPGRYGCAKCVRGLLCDKCNRLIGMVAEDPEWFENAGEYVRRGIHHDTNPDQTS